ncbi:MAG: hypothetical protein ACXACU_11090, partial [Candidatus Hodarchaeales archaeon]
QKISTIINKPVSDGKLAIIDRNIEEFYTSQPNKSSPWKFIPSTMKNQLKPFEESCKEATKQSFEGKIVDYSSLFLAEDIRSMNLVKKDFQKMKIGKLNYYRIHPTLGLGNFLQQNKSLQAFSLSRYARLGDIVDIGNGMVSGLDKAFRINFRKQYSSKEAEIIIPVVKAKNLCKYYVNSLQDYFFVKPDIIQTEEDLKKEFPLIFDHLKPFKRHLLNRYQYNRVIPYWEWVFLRNYELMKKAQTKICVPCKDRFDKRGYFRFAICGKDVYATQDVTVLVKFDWIRESIEYLSAFLNSKEVFDWVRNKGLIRGGVAEFSEQPLKVIPFRFINWNSAEETEIHDQITKLVHQIHENKIDDVEKINEVNSLVSHLFA